MTGSRINQYDTQVTVDGQPLGTFDSMSGGEVDSDEIIYKPGAMAPAVSLGGSVNIGDITVAVLYDLDTIHSQAHWLISRAGKGTMVVKKQPLDVDGNAYGRPLVYSGRLKTVTPPDVDSEASDAAKLTLVMTPAGTVA